MDRVTIRSRIEDAFQRAEFLDNLIDAFSDAFASASEITAGLSIREHIENEGLLSGTNYNVIEDSKITEILYLEADEYLAKALCNLCAGCVCLNKGYLSWGEVTVYYASFFAIHGLMRLQGKAMGVNYVLFPESIRLPASIVTNKYSVARPVGDRKIHEDVWRKFFGTYSQNTDIDQRKYADAIFFTDVQDIVLEVERRNNYNYRIFEAYKEIFDRGELGRRDLFQFVAMDPLFFTRLREYLGDSDRRYVAKAALRVELLHDLLFLISGRVGLLRGFFLERHEQRLAFLDAVLSSSDPIDRACIEEGCLVIP